MAEDQAHFEWLERASQELQQKYTKSCDDISQMIEMLKILTREKQSVEAPKPQTEATPLRGMGEDILYLQGFPLPRENPITNA